VPGAAGGSAEEGIVITKRGRPIARVVPLRPKGKGERVTLPLLKGKGRPGPLCPNTETPYGLVLDDGSVWLARNWIGNRNRSPPTPLRFCFAGSPCSVFCACSRTKRYGRQHHQSGRGASNIRPVGRGPRVELVAEPRGAETLFRQAIALFASKPPRKRLPTAT